MKDSAPLPSVLIIGGDTGETAALERALCDGFDCHVARDRETAWSLMRELFVQVVIASDDLPAGLCPALTGRWPETVVVRLGAPAPGDAVPGEQILSRPVDPGQLVQSVSVACRLFRLARDNERLALEMRCLRPARPRNLPASEGLGFESILRAPGSAMSSVIALARQYAVFDVPMLLLGEMGSGRAALARAIHDGSLRSDRSFHALDLDGLGEEAAMLALFGRRKPANGSPPVNRMGLLRKSEQGTLYLSGIDTLPRPLQERLLRFARTGQFEPDGSAETETSGARLIVSTRSDPRDAMGEGRLDPALYYALAIAEIAVPPLRDRRADIPLLARRLAEEAGQRHDKPVQGLSEEAVAFLLNHSWPGNLLELENEITRMLIKAQDPVLGPDLLSRHILQASPVPEAAAPDAIMTGQGPLKDRIEAIEARILRETLTRLKWNKSRSAGELGLSRVGLRAKLDRYGIVQPQKEEA